MSDLADRLINARDLLFIGVGNILRSDDGVGVHISRRIIERTGIRALTVEVSIENYIGKIQSMNPGEIIMIDCMDLGEEAGSYRMLDLDDLEDLTFNTHNISLGRWKDFFPFPARVLGIQPQELSFGEILSPPVLCTANSIVGLINSLRITDH